MLLVVGGLQQVLLMRLRLRGSKSLAGPPKRAAPKRGRGGRLGRPSVAWGPQMKAFWTQLATTGCSKPAGAALLEAHDLYILHPPCSASRPRQTHKRAPVAMPRLVAYPPITVAAAVAVEWRRGAAAGLDAGRWTRDVER